MGDVSVGDVAVGGCSWAVGGDYCTLITWISKNQGTSHPLSLPGQQQNNF